MWKICCRLLLALHVLDRLKRHGRRRRRPGLQNIYMHISIKALIRMREILLGGQITYRQFAQDDFGSSLIDLFHLVVDDLPLGIYNGLIF